MAKWFLLTSFAFSILLASCAKDELTLPAKVYFSFGFKFHEEELILDNPERDALKSKLPPNFGGKLEINRGTLIIGSLEFDGRRDEGRDVFFVSDLQEPLVVDLATGEVNHELSFDIPQGVYNMVEIHLNPGGGATPLVLEGTISRGAVTVIPVRFEFNLMEKLRVRAETTEAGKIVLRRDIPAFARLEVDASTIFRFINPSMLRDAMLSNIDGVETLLINPDKNQELFNALASRVEKSISVVFN